MVPIRSLTGVILLLLAAFPLVGCGEEPTDADRKALARLEAKYGEGYSFEFKDEQYVLVYPRGKAAPGQERGYEMYMLFRASEENAWNKRTTAYIFMNFYDSNDNFLFQAGPGGITDIEFY